MTSRLTRLTAICQDHNVVSIYAFGSRAKEALRFIEDPTFKLAATTSDLDIAVTTTPAAPFGARGRVRLAQALEDLFHVNQVDLIHLAEAKAFLAADAIRGELLYCDDLDRQAREELYFLRRAADLAFFQKQRQEGILDGTLRK